MSEHLPQGWTTASLSDIADINPRHPRDLDDDFLVSFAPMPALSESRPEFSGLRERPLGEVRKGFTHFAEGDVLFAKITPCMENGKAAVATRLHNGLGCGTTELHVLRPRGGINPFYIYHFIHQPSFRHAAEANFTGTAGQLRVPVAFVEKAEVPIAPLGEQQRIVAKLEKLLGKVDACQQRLAKIPILLKRFRQSVLAAACSGRLTVDWREENPNCESAQFGVPNDELPNSWRTCPLSEVVQVSSGEAFKKSEYSESGARLLQIANVSFGKIIWEQRNFLPLSYLKSHSDLVLKDGDILMALNRPLLNWRIKIAKITEGDLPAILYQRVGRFSPVGGDQAINADYLFQFLQSFGFIHELNERLRGTDQPYVNPPEMLEILLPVPPLAEQQEIVRRVEALFALADQIEARYAKAKAHVEKLTQSILAKAFRGELVPQDPNDEPASVLLETLRQQRNNNKGNKHPQARTKRT
jgi:type I restriction enzyme S subunit